MPARRNIGTIGDAPPGTVRFRERMLRFGPETLETEEVLALIIDGGSTRSGALRQAGCVLRESGGLSGLVRLETPRLLGMQRVDEQTGTRLSAALELFRRLQALGHVEDDRLVVDDPAVAAGLLLPHVEHLRKEQFGVLLLDSRNRMERRCTISVGSLNGSLVHPREVFREALLAAAASIILYHNHPSGDPTPSREDLAVTQRLVRAGSLLGVDVLDHLVLGRGRYVSMKERELM